MAERVVDRVYLAMPEGRQLILRRLDRLTRQVSHAVVLRLLISFHGQTLRYAGPDGTYSVHSARVKDRPVEAHSRGSTFTV